MQYIRLPVETLSHSLLGDIIRLALKYFRNFPLHYIFVPSLKCPSIPTSLSTFFHSIPSSSHSPSYHFHLVSDPSTHKNYLFSPHRETMNPSIVSFSILNLSGSIYYRLVIYLMFNIHIYYIYVYSSSLPHSGYFFLLFPSIYLKISGCSSDPILRS